MVDNFYEVHEFDQIRPSVYQMFVIKQLETESLYCKLQHDKIFVNSSKNVCVKSISWHKKCKNKHVWWNVEL